MNISHKTQSIFLMLISGMLFCFSCHADPSQTMSLEEKIGQLLMVHFHGAVANEEAKSLIQDIKVGGIIYYNWSNDLDSPEQVRTLSNGLQNLSMQNNPPIPLLIATDQEGGRCSRLQKGFTVFPGNGALGDTQDVDLAEAAAFVMGKEMLAVGVNMNLAPVVDINTNPKNPIIGTRAFGDTPQIVIAFGKSALAGYSRSPVITTLKHFPGHGDVETDSHQGLPIVRKSLEQLNQEELLPFAQLGPFSDCIMTAHMLVPALDSENCTTLSSKTLSYLRNTLGFQGLIISDSLVMEGVLKQCGSVDEACILALNAGCDILLLGGKLFIGEHAGFELDVNDVRRIHASLVYAVKDGRITQKRVDEAFRNILKLKNRYPLVNSSADLQMEVGTSEHQALARNIVQKSLKDKNTTLTP
jgi:beta-N-acetylhexosaminidase